MSTRLIAGLLVDNSKGYDAMRGSKVMRHFDSYEEASAYIEAKRGYYLRYWGVKEEE